MAVAALLAGSAAAIVVTQHLRDEGPVATSIHWKKRPGPRYRVCFRLTRDDTVEASVVDATNRVVRTVADEPLRGGDTPHCFDWDGRDSTGRAAPPGPYHLRLSLRDADRVAFSGERLNISPVRAARTARASS
jgi:FlgD Ig-like domain